MNLEHYEEVKQAIEGKVSLLVVSKYHSIEEAMEYNVIDHAHDMLQCMYRRHGRIGGRNNRDALVEGKAQEGGKKQRPYYSKRRRTQKKG